MVNLASDLNMHGLTQAPATGGGTGGSGIIEFNGKRYEPQYAMKLINRPYPVGTTHGSSHYSDNFTISSIPNGNSDTYIGQDIVVFDMNNKLLSRTVSSSSVAFSNGVIHATRGGSAGASNEEYIFIDPENNINIVKKRTEIAPSGTAGMGQVFSFNGKIGVVWANRRMHILDNDGTRLGEIDLPAIIATIPGAIVNPATLTLENNGAMVYGDDLYLLFKYNSQMYFMNFDVSGSGMPTFKQGYYFTNTLNSVCKGIKKEGIFVYVIYSLGTTGAAYTVVLRASDLVVASAFGAVKSLPYNFGSVNQPTSYSDGAIYFYSTARTITVSGTNFQMNTAVMLTISVDNVGTPYVKEYDIDTGYEYMFLGTTPFVTSGSFYFKSIKAVSHSVEGAVLHSLEPTFIGYKEVTI